ncbi:MAG: cellulase family glycosylhydrolase, partial [Oricola sp.]
MSMISLIRATLAAVVAAALTFAAPVMAAQFSVSRGLNLDQWETWPEPDRWNAPEVMNNFPEWKKFVTADDLAALRASGLDFLRMPVDPAVFLIDPDPARQKRLFAQVADAVERIRAAGLKVIVDLHTIPRSDGNLAPGIGRILADPAQFAAYRRLVADMASHLARFAPDAVALQIVNEPTIDCGRGGRHWPGQLADLHAAARAANTEITLVLQGACWGSAVGLAALDPAALHDTNVIWSFHSYEPFILTHQGAEWASEEVKLLSGLPYPFSGLKRRERKAAVDANLARIERGANGG